MNDETKKLADEIAKFLVALKQDFQQAARGYPAMPNNGASFGDPLHASMMESIQKLRAENEELKIANEALKASLSAAESDLAVTLEGRKRMKDKLHEVVNAFRRRAAAVAAAEQERCLKLAKDLRQHKDLAMEVTASYYESCAGMAGSIDQAIQRLPVEEP